MAYSKLIFISFLCVLAMDVFNQISSLIGVPAWSQNFLLVLNLVSAIGLFVFSNKIQWKRNLPLRGLLVIQLFWLWSFITFIRGFSNANDYWDFKVLMLGYLPSVAVSLAVVLGVNFKFSTKLLSFLLFRLFPVSFLFIPFTLAYTDEFYSRLVMPVCLFVLISPYLQKKWQLLVIAVALTSIAMDVSYRANALRLMIPLMLLILFYFRPALQSKLMNWVLAGLLCVPLIFLTLGVNGTFNVFTENKMDFEVGTMLQGEVGTSNFSTDTRTFLYAEVLSSMNNRNSSFLIGEGGSAGYETEWFADAILNEKGRFRSEVGFLNTLLYSGAVGVLLYALVLFVPAYYAINKSNNRLCKLIGLFLAARWSLFFVEDIAMFDMNFFFLWFMIGLCLSNKFREMTDEQLANLFGASRSDTLPVALRGSNGAGMRGARFGRTNNRE